MPPLRDELLVELLSSVQKPARYTGGEYNQVRKAGAQLRMAVCYPDLYEVGMSNHGIRILYDIVNSIEWAACERVFAVDMDMEARLRAMGLRLFTIETRTPLCELDMLAFNLSHELLYTNLLQVLDLGGIPLAAADRGEACPIVIAGGEAACNPAPMGEFVDAFYLGDGEEGIVELAECLLRAKRQGVPRTGSLAMLEEIEGVYIPSLHRYVRSNGRLAAVEGKRVKKRSYRASSPHFPLRPIVPNIRVAQDRAIVEVTRGCSNMCRFCHAGYYDLPCREYAPGALSDGIMTMLDNSGYDELTLASLSISDYRGLVDLLNKILPGLNERGVSVSLPSLRVDTGTLPIIEGVSSLRKASLTFAVESASEQMRMLANKRISTEDLLSIMAHVFEKGWRTIKLYFMIGLPGCETTDEAVETAALLKRIASLARGKREINVTVSPFVPKPLTPFQWERQMDAAYFLDVVKRLKREAPRQASIKNHNVESSVLEGLLSRGDERLSSVILGAYMDGARLDSWSEHFDYALWERNLNARLPDWSSLLERKPDDTVFPWDAVETGFEGLLDIHKSGRVSPSSLAKRATRPMPALTAHDGSLEAFERKYTVAGHARLRLSKTGLARYVPHIDFIEIVKRSLRMAGVPVSFSQGFNKRERVSSGFPLPLGVESLCEFLDVDLYMETDVMALPGLMNGRLPEGIRVESARRLDSRESLMALTGAMEYAAVTEDGEILSAMRRNVESRVSFTREAKKGTVELAFDDAVLKAEFDDEGLRLLLSTEEAKALRIDRAVMALAEISADRLHRVRLIRLRQFRLTEAGPLEIF
ncbi:MAG TPA: TIGR03960 family B12-binding radical SAM protein [Spirochaetota bacterium]|nr:TIGR03960 family B12-binding radical SAM protein [Spirochaetota bacterium]